MNFHFKPLSFYLDMLRSGRNFTSLLFGDGEMSIACGRTPVGTPYTQYREVVTERLRVELSEALHVKDHDVFHGTDVNLVNYDDYRGQDKRSIVELGVAFKDYYALCPDWYDGVVWEDTLRAERFLPFFRELSRRRVVAVANPRVLECNVLGQAEGIPLPDRDAARRPNLIEAQAERHLQPDTVCVVCAGLGAIPLILRLRKLHPRVTYLDLGSTFDIFCGLGGERGWRRELYENPDRLKAFREANTGRKW